MKRFLAILVALILCFSLFAACGEEESASEKELNDTVVATINGVEISQADYNLIYKMLYDNVSQYQTYYGENWLIQPYDNTRNLYQFIKDSTVTQLEQFVAAQLIAEERYGISLDDVKDDAKEQKKLYIENLGGQEAYENLLKSMRTTDKAMERSFEMIEIYNRLEEKITAEGEEAYITDEDAFESFKSEKMRVQHILISTQEQTDSETGEVIPARTQQEALKLVDEVLKKIAEGEDFDTLIEQYDEDPGMDPGKYYVFGTGEMVEEFENASMELEVGEYTEKAVETSYGYHIIKKYELTSDLQEFADYKAQLMQQNLMMIIDSKLIELEVVWETESLDEYVLAWVNELRKEQGLEALTEETLGITFPTEEEMNTAETDVTEEDAE